MASVRALTLLLPLLAAGAVNAEELARPAPVPEIEAPIGVINVDGRKSVAFRLATGDWVAALHALSNAGTATVSYGDRQLTCTVTRRLPALDSAFLRCPLDGASTGFRLREAKDAITNASVGYIDVTRSRSSWRELRALDDVRQVGACALGPAARAFSTSSDIARSGAPIVTMEGGERRLVGFVASIATNITTPGEVVVIAVDARALVNPANDSTLFESSLIACNTATRATYDLPTVSFRDACIDALLAQHYTKLTSEFSGGPCAEAIGPELEKFRQLALMRAIVELSKSHLGRLVIVADSAFRSRSAALQFLAETDSELEDLWNRVNVGKKKFGNVNASAFETQLFTKTSALIAGSPDANAGLDDASTLIMLSTLVQTPLAETDPRMLCAFREAFIALGWSGAQAFPSREECASAIPATWSSILDRAEHALRRCGGATPLRARTWASVGRSPRQQVALWLAFAEEGVLDLARTLRAISGDPEGAYPEFPAEVAALRALVEEAEQVLPPAATSQRAALANLKRLLPPPDTPSYEQFVFRAGLCSVPPNQRPNQGFAVEYLTAIAEIKKAVCSAETDVTGPRSSMICRASQLASVASSMSKADAMASIRGRLEAAGLHSLIKLSEIEAHRIPAAGQDVRRTWVTFVPASGTESMFWATWSHLNAQERREFRRSLNESLLHIVAGVLAVPKSTITILVDAPCYGALVRGAEHGTTTIHERVCQGQFVELSVDDAWRAAGRVLAPDMSMEIPTRCGRDIGRVLTAMKSELHADGFSVLDQTNEAVAYRFGGGRIQVTAHGAKRKVLPQKNFYEMLRGEVRYELQETRDMLVFDCDLYVAGGGAASPPHLGNYNVADQSEITISGGGTFVEQYGLQLLRRILTACGD